MNANTFFHSQYSKPNIVYFPDLNLTLFVKLCDLLYQETNVIVNASNPELFLGGGISGAIREKGGSSIQEELNEIRKEKIITVGDVEITNKGLFKNSNLTKIFHAVGPRYSNTINNDNLLKKTFYNCLKKAEENRITSISIPPISSGLFRYPLKTVCSVFYSALASFIDDKISCKQTFILSEIYFCNNDEEGYNVMVDSLRELGQNLFALGNINLRIVYNFSQVFSEGEISSQFPQEDFDEKQVKLNNEIFMKELKNNKSSATKENVRKKAKEDKSNLKITNFFGKK